MHEGQGRDHWATFHGKSSCVWSSRPVVAVVAPQARSDAGFWRDRLNGELMTEQILADRMEVPAVSMLNLDVSIVKLPWPALANFILPLEKKHILVFGVFSIF